MKKAKKYSEKLFLYPLTMDQVLKMCLKTPAIRVQKRKKTDVKEAEKQGS